MIKVSNKLGFILLFIAMGIQVVTMPTSPGNFYEPAHYYNLFLPNFGQNSDLGIIDYFNTVSSMYSLDKIMLEIFGQNILFTHIMIKLLAPLFSFLAFYLFLGLLNPLKRNRVLVSGFLSLVD